jgi:hypothetical protein
MVFTTHEPRYFAPIIYPLLTPTEPRKNPLPDSSRQYVFSSSLLLDESVGLFTRTNRSDCVIVTTLTLTDFCLTQPLDT